jgi:hypothetical protein
MERKDLNTDMATDMTIGCVICSVGSKGAGKTSFMLSVVRACLEKKIYDEYVLILPSYEVEADDAYRFLNDYDDVTIYTRYHEKIAINLYNTNHKAKLRKNTLFVIDDASAFAVDLHNGKSSELVGLISESRHVKVTTWLLAHSLRNILSPIMRENIRYLLLYSITNRKLLESVYEEYMSVYLEKTEFLEWYRNVSREKFSCFMIKTAPPPAVDENSNQWGWVQYHRYLNEIAK